MLILAIKDDEDKFGRLRSKSQTIETSRDLSWIASRGAGAWETPISLSSEIDSQAAQGLPPRARRNSVPLDLEEEMEDLKVDAFEEAHARPSEAKQPQFTSYAGPLYLVEFKSHRTELFYNPEGQRNIFKVADLVIVEADRGEDLGKVIADISVDKLKALLRSEEDAKEIVPKKLIRHAKQDDLRLLSAKSQEEAIALVRCASRVRQKKLPMEVVDAEYQW